MRGTPLDDQKKILKVRARPGVTKESIVNREVTWN